jgi:hypothetical protein
MKEHAIFIEGTLPPPGKMLAARAERFKQQYDRLLASTIRLASGSVTREALQAGQYYTRFTEEAEQITQRLTGIATGGELTRTEYNIEPINPHTAAAQRKEQEVSSLNQSIQSLTTQFKQFKSELLSSRSTCRLFSFMYPADMEHVLNEAKKYIEVLTALQRRDENVADDYKRFWTHNMSDHSKTMRGMFDPTETNYFSVANQFANMFDALLQEQTPPVPTPYAQTDNTLAATNALSEFKADTTRGIIECRVKSIMLPLYTDHLLREANHFIFLMRT